MRRVTVFFAVYVAVMSALALYRWHIWSYGADTGTFTQSALNVGPHLSVWSGSDASGAYLVWPPFLGNTSELGSHLHVHWSPILALLAPFVWLTHSGLSIQIVQAVLIGAGIFPFYAFLRRYLDDGLATALANLVLIYPPLLAVAFDEFHEIAFYPPLVFALLWAIDAGRWFRAALCAFALLFVREEALLVMAVFGCLLAVVAARRAPHEPRGLLYLEPREPRPALVLGLAMLVAGPAVFAFYFGVVAPALGGWTASHYYSYPFARGPAGIVLALFTRPLEVIGAIATFGRATYLLEAFAPLLFLPLRSRWMIVALPGLAIVVLSSDPIAWRMGSHYSGIFAPWLLVGTAATLATFAAQKRVVAGRLASGVVAVCALVLVAFDPLHPLHYMKAPYADLADAERAFAAVPPGASVFTHDEWYAHVAGRRPAAEHTWNEPDYAVLADDFPNAATFEPFMQEQLARGCYAVAQRFAAVVVYRRVTTVLSSPDAAGRITATDQRCRIERAGRPTTF